ncbi:TonB-dependent receptor [Pedobacter heparinus]|uniref:TonB-dependent receptor n=1 Tax=Pedobacter heparinus (strain ATCC 13125 / DSM 2366 / CIP 104194 / JCM 7457 / NBRC 12017 / NCIMB 9290 / NRRL B-14731 / HIM 762-3) TaxID=485917 RepID=C6XVY5_PEDHD|nr:TonB-dependent receptor [Pedobacter heparinus]ACU04064.1 TonB-dependent receptor [Pedobacter heparinus DSM 2366]
MLRTCLLVFVVLLGFGKAVAQPLIKISGLVTDELGKSLQQVTVTVIGQSQSTITDEQGAYNIYSKSKIFTLKYTLLGYNTILVSIKQDKAGRVTQHVVMRINPNELEQVTITNKQNQLSNSTLINLTDAAAMPSVSGNFEAVLKTLPGVSPNNELSAQYSVRGGSFDENLVYVNDVEISRPVLVRNAQQEGLSFINTDLLSSAKFSAGGFEARYGDKLSSVLDVKYDRPDSSSAAVSAGLLGLAFSSKIVSPNSYLLTGIRYKNNTGILNSQDNKGVYTPSFTDVQLLYNYNLSSRFSLSLLGNYNSGRFKLIPESRETEFGTADTKLRLNVDYEGEEKDNYQSAGAAITLKFTPRPDYVIKWISSYFKTDEKEHIDIAGWYLFDKDDGPSTSKESSIGGYINYAMNKLTSQNFSTELKADQTFKNHTFSWGLRFENKDYNDDLNEYSLIDSAGYIANQQVHNFYQNNSVVVKNKLTIQYYTAYMQDSYRLSANTDLQLGLRAGYNSLSTQFLLSPRLLLAYRPVNNRKIFRFSAGVYQQAPDYRSIRDFNGMLNLHQKAQRSYNTSAGLDYAFDALGTRLKFSSELYFKYLDRLVPYMMDNVRVKYLAGEVATGYTYGADFNIGGEFVKDLLSYFRISFMKSAQDLKNDGLGYLKRPADQRVNFSAYFQDRLLNSPAYKVHLTLLYGAKLPVGSPLLQRYSDDFHIPAYKRVDIGFSKDFLDDFNVKKSGFLEKYFSSFTASVEVFNLLNINNTVSYLWLKDLDNVQYAVPNYLTGRRLNVKLVIKFKKSK